MKSGEMLWMRRLLQFIIIQNNNIWKLVSTPNGKKPMNVKYIYKEKKNQIKGGEIQSGVSGKKL